MKSLPHPCFIRVHLWPKPPSRAWSQATPHPLPLELGHFTFDRHGRTRVACDPFKYMFGTIRKHQNWLWYVIIAVMIFGLVIWGNQLGKNGNQHGNAALGKIEGREVTEAEYRDAQAEATLMSLLRNHRWPDNVTQQEVYERIFLLRKLQQYNIHADADSVAQIATMYVRQFANGQQVPFNDFVDQVLKPHNITAEDFERFLEHDLSIQQLASVVGVSGKLVSPAEIQALYVQENQEVAVDAVFFSASNYLAKIAEPTAAELGSFYTNQMATYREPEQLQLSYIFFNVTNFMPEAEQKLGTTNLNREAEEALTRLGTNGLRYGKTPEEAKAKIREILIQDTAISNAYAKAIVFQNELVAKEPQRIENLAAIAKEKGLEVKVTKPFDKEYGPSDINLASGFPVAELFNLTTNEPFAEQPIRGLDGVYILGYNKLIPSRVPSLSEIHSRLVSDYKIAQAMRMAQINGRIFSQTITNEMNKGKTFTEACALDKVTSVSVPPFSLGTPTIPQVEDHTEVTTFKDVAFSTQPGKVSGFAPTRDGGFIVHVRERLPVDQAKMKAQLPEFSNLVRQRRENEAFDFWYRTEASKALREIPVFQKQQQPSGM